MIFFFQTLDQNIAIKQQIFQNDFLRPMKSTKWQAIDNSHRMFSEDYFFLLVPVLWEKYFKKKTIDLSNPWIKQVLYVNMKASFPLYLMLLDFL